MQCVWIVAIGGRLMAQEQTPPTTAQSNISALWRFPFSLKLLLIVVCVLALAFALVGMQMRAAWERREAQRFADTLALRAIVGKACADLNLGHGGGYSSGGEGADIHEETGLWTTGAGGDIPRKALVALEEETKRRLNEVHVEIVDVDGLVDAPASRGIQVAYRYRSVRGLIQFRLTHYEPPQELAEVEGRAYLTGTHVQFR